MSLNRPHGSTRFHLLVLAVLACGLAACVWPAHAEKPLLRIAFTRHLDPGGTEGYRLVCASARAKAECDFHVTRNETVVKTRKIAFEKAQSIAENFLKAQAASAGGEAETDPPLLTWEVQYREQALKGLVPRRHEPRPAPPSAERARAVLELEYRLMELDE